MAVLESRRGRRVQNKLCGSKVAGGESRRRSTIARAGLRFSILCAGVFLIRPTKSARIRQADLIENAPDNGVNHRLERSWPAVKGRNGGQSSSVTTLRAWIKFHGVSRGTSTSLRRSFKKTSAARRSALSLEPEAIRPRVAMEQGTTTIASKRAEPLTNGTLRSFSRCCAIPSGTLKSFVSCTATCLACALMTR